VYICKIEFVTCCVLKKNSKMGTIARIKKKKNGVVKITNESVYNRFGTCKDLMLVEEDSLRTGIKKHGRDAFKNVLSKGITATVLEGNNICKVSPDGKNKIIAQVGDSGVRVSHRTFKIE